MLIAALYVETAGSYFGLPHVDPWDIGRDARQYSGPHPVVAHPPCQRWGKMWFGSPLTVKRTGQRKAKGDDGGCFAAGLASIRRWGGILEHPWGSHAWAHFGLNKPARAGGWIAADFEGGWTCCVEQGRYGHYARKPTLLLAYHCDLPELDWGVGKSRLDPAVIERMGLERAKRLGEVGSRGGGTDSTPRIGTPQPFRDLLISIARTARPTGRNHDDHNIQGRVSKPDKHDMSDETNQSRCELCGEPMPDAETMFKYHGLSGPCTPLPRRRNHEISINYRDDGERYWLMTKIDGELHDQISFETSQERDRAADDLVAMLRQTRGQ